MATRHSDGSSTEAESDDDGIKEIEATQQDPVPQQDGPTEGFPFVWLVNRRDRSKVKVYFMPGMPAQVAGRNPPKGGINLGNDKQISNVHLVFISLASGIRVVDVSKFGTFLLRFGKRIRLPSFGVKPPFPQGQGPSCQHMSPDLQPGMVLQLGHSGRGMDDHGVETILPYTEAEFEIVAGEGQCGTGPHSSNKRKQDTEEVMDDHGRHPTFASAARQQAKRRRDSARARSGERYAEVQQRHVSNRGRNTKFQVHDKRAMERLVFFAHNENASKGGWQKRKKKGKGRKGWRLGHGKAGNGGQSGMRGERRGRS
jgi:hypothetical protein